MSTLIDAEIVNVLVLAAVREADLGSHRKITRFRLQPRIWPLGARFSPTCPAPSGSDDVTRG
jgi:hypothetical protein